MRPCVRLKEGECSFFLEVVGCRVGGYSYLTLRGGDEGAYEEEED